MAAGTLGRRQLENTGAPAPFVLVGGYWLGPWAWADVGRLLEAAGHRVDVRCAGWPATAIRCSR